MVYVGTDMAYGYMPDNRAPFEGGQPCLWLASSTNPLHFYDGLHTNLMHVWYGWSGLFWGWGF